MKIKETIVRYRWPIGVILLLAVIGFFVFREVKSLQSDRKAERELLLRQRKEAEADIEARHKEELRKSDSAYMELLGIKTKVEIKIIEREKWITKFIDTASIRSKHKYLDSLFGPE